MKKMLAIVLLLCQGCATSIVRFVEPEYGTLYPASTLDVLGVVYLAEDQKQGGDELHCLVVLPLIDLPFSLVTDTVLLPADLAVMGCKACKE